MKVAWISYETQMQVIAMSPCRRQYVPTAILSNSGHHSSITMLHLTGRVSLAIAILQ